MKSKLKYSHYAQIAGFAYVFIVVLVIAIVVLNKMGRL
jgi:hypothetical protein